MIDLSVFSPSEIPVWVEKISWIRSAWVFVSAAATIAEGTSRATSKANVGPDKVAKWHVSGRTSFSICRTVHNELISIPFAAFIIKVSGLSKGASSIAIFLTTEVGTTSKIIVLFWIIIRKLR